MRSLQSGSRLTFAIAALLVVGLAAPALASPAPLPACPPCSDGFVGSAGSHGLETEVRHSEATVRVHENGSATWTARVVPTNETVLNRLAENESLGRSVAADSFGTRYGDGIQHELLGADVEDGAFVVRYRTLDVVEDGPFGTSVLTYFRDSPGAYIYTDLGADELTVVAPDGTTVARGFGDVSGGRLTATALPDTPDGPFVVFASEEAPLPGVVGWLAVVSALGGVILRNTFWFVALPGTVLVGGLAGVRRLLSSETERRPERFGAVVAVAGAAVLVGSVVTEADALPRVTSNLVVGGFVGATLSGLGGAVASRAARRYLTGWRVLAAGAVVGALGALAVTAVGGSSLHRALSTGVVLFPGAVALGWADASATGEGPPERLFAALGVAVLGALLVTAPLTTLGGTLFIIGPLLLTLVSVGFVAAALPLYLLGVAGADSRTG